jgi:hypothetical protein
MPPMRTTAQLIEMARAEERDRITKMVESFSWVLPMHKDRTMNVTSDDAAESVRKQIAVAIRALT